MACTWDQRHMLTISALSNSRELNIPAKLEWNTTICLHAGCGMMVPTCLAFPLMPVLKCVHQNTCTIFHCIGGLLQIIGAHVDSFTLVGGVYNGFYMAGCLLAVCSPGTGGAFATLAEWPFQHDMFPGMKLEVYHNHCHMRRGCGLRLYELEQWCCVWKFVALFQDQGHSWVLW